MDRRNKYSMYSGFLFGLGLFLFVIMCLTAVWAFNTVGTTEADPNVINVSPNLSSGTSDTDNNSNDDLNVNVLIFKPEYTSSDGSSTITAKSSNGDNIVAPGTEETGVFSVKNSSGSKLATKLEFFSKDTVYIPINVKLIDGNGNYLLGDEANYASSKSLNGVTAEYILQPGQSIFFTLPWSWAYETKDQSGSIAAGDKYDTSLGNGNVEAETLCIGLNAHSEIIPDESQYVPGVPGVKTSDFLPWIIAILLILLIITIILYIISRKKMKESENNNDKNTQNNASVGEQSAADSVGSHVNKASSTNASNSNTSDSPPAK